MILHYALSVLIPLSLIAASPAPPRTSTVASVASPTPTREPACEGPEFRQFDFWIGKWIVRNPEGKEVGRSEISQESAGCAIREQWKGVSGVRGMSINYYDPAERQWHQDWVGGDGAILHLRGGLQDGAMVLSGDTQSREGRVINRITWTPLPNDRVKQEWAISSDDGKTWQTSFVGLYDPQA